MKRLTAILPLLAAAVLPACDVESGDTVTGRGPVIEENRPVGPFLVVSNSTMADVEIVQGSDEDLWITAQENLLRYIETRVENNILRIYTRPGVILQPTEPITIELEVVDLERIESSGSGYINAPILDAGRLEVVASGSGGVDVPSLLADSLIIIGSGSGEITATGTVLEQRLVLSGSQLVDFRNLQSNEADVIMSGSGPATIRVRDRLRAVLSGSGSLRYYGSPQVQQTVTGTGRVERAGS
jgi:hypothetical protein